MFRSDSKAQLIKAAKCMNRGCFVENGVSVHPYGASEIPKFVDSCLPHDVPPYSAVIYCLIPRPNFIKTLFLLGRPL